MRKEELHFQSARRDIATQNFCVLSGMNAKTPKCNLYRQELNNSSMQNEAIWYFSAKVILLKISEKLQFANSMSAEYSQAVMRDKHRKVNGQLPVQILDFILNIQTKSPYTPNSKLQPLFFCSILTWGFSIRATVGITEVAILSIIMSLGNSTWQN